MISFFIVLLVCFSQIHPTIVQIGLRYASGVICGSNARAVALLCALTQVSVNNNNDLLMSDKLSENVCI